MTTNIVYKRPEHPVDFMIEEIEELKKTIDPNEKETGASWYWILLFLFWMVVNFASLTVIKGFGNILEQQYSVC